MFVKIYYHQKDKDGNWPVVSEAVYECQKYAIVRPKNQSAGVLVIDDGREIAFEESVDIYAMSHSGKTFEIVWRPDRTAKAA